MVARLRSAASFGMGFQSAPGSESRCRSAMPCALECFVHEGEAHRMLVHG